MRRFLIGVLFLSAVCHAPAADAAGAREKLGWRVDAVSLQGGGDSLRVSVTYTVLDWNVDPNGAAVFCAKLENGERRATLTPVAVYGRKAVSQSQKGAVSGNDGEYQILNFRGPVTFTLTDVLPLRDWMDTVRVTLTDSEWTRRGGLVQRSKRTLETYYKEPAPVIDLGWDYVAPRERRGTYSEVVVSLPVAFLGSDVDASPEYSRKNLDSLGVIARSFTSSRRVTVRSAELSVSTDPEGTDRNNLNLSRRRASAVYTYLQKRGSFKNVTPGRTGTGEDWQGMVDWMESHGMVDDAVGETLSSGMSRDDMESAIRRNSPALWERLDSVCFPLLSRVAFRASFRRPSFRDARAVEPFFEETPWMLEPFDFWYLAMNSDRKSDRCLDILMKGLEYWPESEELNLDAAFALMSRNLLPAAMVCLRYAGEGVHAQYARGMWMYLSGRYDEALPFFGRAAGQGVSDYDRVWSELQRHEGWKHGEAVWRKREY